MKIDTYPGALERAQARGNLVQKRAHFIIQNFRQVLFEYFKGGSSILLWRGFMALRDPGAFFEEFTGYEI